MKSEAILGWHRTFAFVLRSSYYHQPEVLITQISYKNYLLISDWILRVVFEYLKRTTKNHYEWNPTTHYTLNKAMQKKKKSKLKIFLVFLQKHQCFLFFNGKKHTFKNNFQLIIYLQVKNLKLHIIMIRW